MPKQATAIETTNANKIFDLPVSLQPGQVNTMSFPQDSIAEMHLTPANELEVTFRDGSRVQIENFQELVNSAQSCGRDTIIQLSDNTIIYPEELNSQLAQGPVSFVEKNADGNVITALSEPKAGQIVETQVEPGKEYKMNFDFDRTASAAQAGENLIVTFKDGGVMVLKNYFTSMDSELPPALTLADGAVINSDALLTSCKLVESPSFAELVADEAKETTVAETQVEPAAGEEQAVAQKAEKVQNIEPAAGEAVADIEPAAGDGGGPLAGGRGGYGFASEPGAVALGGINAIGAIGATQLGYQTPNYRNGPTGPNAPTTAAFVGPAAALSVIDETGPSHSVSGKVNFNFGNDGPSTTEPPVQVTGNFGASGSLTNNALTSNGQPITVSFSGGNTYTGTAGGQTVFTFVVNPDGTYTFTQNAALDHADGSDANDRIILNFGIVGIDRDGDRAPTSVNVYVYDDAPVAVDDNTSVSETMPTVTGNVTTNDKFGSDGKPSVQPVTKVIYNGTTYDLPANGTNVTITTANGTLTINSNGQYSYTATTQTGGVDNFQYVIKDRDGDTDTSASTGTLKVTIDDVDFTPTVTSDVKTVDETNLGPIVVNGAVTANYFSDGPGSVSGSNSFSSGGSKLGGNLTSNGVAVAVTFANGTYTGTAGGQTIFTLKVNADGSYTFTQNGPLDHADKSNPDDSIELNFGIVARDADGDTANGTIKIIVKDDGPTAVDDNTNVTQGNPTVTGNVTTNDDFGSDGKPSVQPVTKVIYNGTTYDLPANGTNVTITTANGTLTINSNGQYSYTATTQTGGVDNFQYVIKDRDGDTDTSASTGTLKVTIDDVDFTPTVTSDVKTVDETNLGPIVVNGAVTANYFSDGPGSVSGSNSFSSGGSKLGGNLTSNGVAVAVTFANGTYTGTAGGQTIFTLKVNADGSYTFTQNGPLDHADKSNPDDSIELNFGIVARDADGDTANGTIKIIVKDDGPTAVDDNTNVTQGNPTVTGNVTTNDDFGSDGKPSVQPVTKVIYNGTTYDLPANGTNVTITTANGTLTINSNGQYSYTATTQTGGVDNFQYVIKDRDGDTDTSASTGTLKVTIDDVDFTPTVTSDAKVVDETNMNPTTGVTGAVTANYFSDGPGSITGTGAGSFSSAGSKAGGNLTSNGVAVVVSYANGVYTGKAGNETVFTLTINANGQYSFVLNKPLDHADKSNPNDAIDLNFGVVATDADGDKANGNIKITVLDDGPTIGPATSTIDESDFNPTGTVTGKVTADFGSDSQGSSISGNNSFTSTGSLLNGKLTTNGVAITVTQTATGYVGTANGQEVFKLTINNDGSYSYNQSKIIDHADPNNPDDVISLHFGVKATDGDGDTANSTITIDVKDDGPAVVPDPTVNVICEYGNLNIQPNGGVFAKFIVDASGSGNEVVTLKLTGLEAGWTVGTADKTGPGNMFNDFTWTNKGTFSLEADGTYTWTYTLPAGQDFNGYFGFKNNGTSNDLGDLTFTATVTDGGKTATDSEDFSIIVGAPDAAARSMAYSDDLAFDDDAFSSLSDNHHKEVSTFKVVSGVNDNLPAYDQVIESHHSAEQKAIDSFVYETTVEHKPGAEADLKPEVSNWPQVVAATPAEDINQAHQHVA